MLIKCNNRLIDEGHARDYNTNILPPVGSILNIHPFKEAGEEGPTEVYRVRDYEFNITRSWNNTYAKGDTIMHVERLLCLYEHR
jgi:hypothetical protein